MYVWTENAVKWLLEKVKEQTRSPRRFGPVQIPVSAWVEEETEDSYRYAAIVPVDGCTSDNVPIVTFSDKDVDNFYPICESGNNTVMVYAVDIPDDTITLQSIVIM